MACAPQRQVPATIEMSLLIVDPRTIVAPVVSWVCASAQASSQLERGDAEHALEADGADRSSIHPRGLEYRRKAVVARQRDRFTIDTWDVDKDFARATRREQRRDRGLGGSAVVGHQWADPAAAPAWAGHTPSSKIAVAHERAADMPTCADPCAQERRARRRKHRGVVRL